MSTLEDHFAEKPPKATVTLRGIATGAGGVMLLFDAPPWGSRRSKELSITVAKLLEISLFDRGSKIEGSEIALSSEHPLLLDYGPRASIFGQAPLPDPYRFFLEFHKLVRDQLGIPREPLRYLNRQGRMSPWLSLVYSRSFNLLTGPKPVAEAAGELLTAQVAEYIVLDEKPLEGGQGAKALTLGEFWVVGTGFALGG